ncbi:uncharacterized protein LOC110829859 [Zootermopsis nevadensis]|uniref:uncharacterized protein LOC110829859 n=1 Tax=Zootermopsis nevadensis TaxID=136037 RepID=UPI000B8E521B|nr:uncharacterized protein LOC110829859 [Zootermopsis nevadensis]
MFIMALPPSSNDVVEYVRASAGVNETRIQEAVKNLKDWLMLQPHLPYDDDEGRLERRFVWCKASLERTKSAIDMYYTLRAVVPEILSNRDPFSPWFRQITSVSYCLPLPTLTDDCHRVVVLGNLDPDASKYNVLDVFKLIFMVGDVRFSEDCCVADTYIVDMTNFGVGHIAKITMPAVKKLEICAIKGYSARIRAIHYVNVPRYADVLINLVRSVMKPKIASRMQVHTKGMNTLHKEIDRKILPEEFGGQAGSISDLWNDWKEKLETYREWFLEQDKLKADESNTSDVSENHFRELDIYKQVTRSFFQDLPTNMDLLLLSKETRDQIRTRAEIDEERIKEAVKLLKKWLELQPHLPNDYDETRMETLFFRCKASIEKCKQTIDLYYSLRTAIPEIYCNRDPSNPWFKLATSVCCFIPLEQLTENYDRVTIIKCLDGDPSNHHPYDMLKLLFMIVEVRTIEDYNMADIFIIDMDNITVSHVVKYTLPVLKKIEVSAMRGFKGRLKGLHLINAPPVVDSAVNAFKSILKPQMAERVHVHRKGSDKLLDYVSPKILPEEYGGEAGSLHDLWTMWKQKLGNYREWFLEQENVKVDESKRPGESFNTSDLFGFEGSFRQLNVD